MPHEIYLRAVAKRKKGQEIKKIETDTPWGKVLEILRVDKKDFAINQFEQLGTIKRAAYRRSLFGTEGPTFANMDKILRAMGCTWHDWANEYERHGFVPSKRVSNIRVKSPPAQKRSGSS